MQPAPDGSVVLVSDIDAVALGSLLADLGVSLTLVDIAQPIPGSYWGESEAGLIGSAVFARADTPVHSVLHEAAHLLVMPAERRAAVHTDATDSVLEEDAACYLQILLADKVDGLGSDRIMADMDAWGYSFRLGSSRAWFENDAEDARHFLVSRTPALWQSLGAANPLAPLASPV